jgi:molecular chaperone HtpG
MVERAQRGTEVTLHLRDGEDEFLSSWKVREIIRKYSDHITLPILMKKEEWNEEKKAQVVTDEDETVNQASALWSASEVGDHRRAVQRVLQARRA